MTESLSLKRLLILLLALPLLVSLSACEDDEDDDDGDLEIGMVQAYHAVPDAPTVQVVVDEQTIGTMSFKESINYTDIEIGGRDISLRLQGETSNLIEASADIELDERYTAFALGEVDDSGQPLQLKVVQDNYDDPAAGQATFRAFHGSPDVGDVDVVVSPDAGGDDIILEDVSLGDVSDFSDVAAASYTVSLYEAGTVVPLTNMLYEETFTLEEGMVYTVAAVGKVSDNSVDLDVVAH